MDLYLLLLLFRRPPAYTFESEDEFAALLSKNNLSEKDLTQLTKSEENKEDKTITTTTFESESIFFVWKVETLNKRNIPEGRSYVYTCTLPGLSITDILEARDKPAFWHINFTQPEVQDAFELLLNEGMLRPMAFSPNGEERYDVYDSSVKKFLEGCWGLYNLVYSLTDLIWNKVRAPTTDEIKRYAKYLKEKYAKVIEKYEFPFDDLLEVIYPKCMQQLEAPIK